MTFKEAAFRFSDDKKTKFNGGVLTAEDGSDKLEKLNLSPTIAYQIAGLNKGDITEVFQDKVQQDRKVVTFVKINDVIAAHKLDITTDYDRIKQMALNILSNAIRFTPSGGQIVVSASIRLYKMNQKSYSLSTESWGVK